MAETLEVITEEIRVTSRACELNVMKNAMTNSKKFIQQFNGLDNKKMATRLMNKLFDLTPEMLWHVSVYNPISLTS
mgnify:CR=1 FL=1